MQTSWLCAPLRGHRRWLLNDDLIKSGGRPDSGERESRNERNLLARKGRLSKGRPFSFSQRPKAEREWCRGAEERKEGPETMRNWSGSERAERKWHERRPSVEWSYTVLL